MSYYNVGDKFKINEEILTVNKILVFDGVQAIEDLEHDEIYIMVPGVGIFEKIPGTDKHSRMIENIKFEINNNDPIYVWDDSKREYIVRHFRRWDNTSVECWIEGRTSYTTNLTAKWGHWRKYE